MNEWMRTSTAWFSRLLRPRYLGRPLYSNGDLFAENLLCWFVTIYREWDSLKAVSPATHMRIKTRQSRPDTTTTTTTTTTSIVVAAAVYLYLKTVYVCGAVRVLLRPECSWRWVSSWSEWGSKELLTCFKLWTFCVRSDRLWYRPR